VKCITHLGKKGVGSRKEPQEDGEEKKSYAHEGVGFSFSRVGGLLRVQKDQWYDIRMKRDPTFSFPLSSAKIHCKTIKGNWGKKSKQRGERKRRRER